MRSLRVRTVLAGLASVALAAAVLAGTATPPSLASSASNIWAWGNGTAGELGNGSTGDSRPTPGQVPGLSGITQIAISYNGTHMFALGPGGVVWGWA